MSNSIIENVMQIYTAFDQASVTALDQIYSENIVFVDPFNRVEGLPALTRYFADMVEGMEECLFEFEQVLESSLSGGSGGVEQAVLFWTMHYRHKKLSGGKKLSLSGNSHLQFAENIFYHRDYFDAGAMLYEHVPLLGFAIRKIKTRMEVA